MIPQQRAALESLRLDWTHTAEDVWTPPPYHVDGLHGEVLAEITRGIGEAQDSPDRSPLGVALQGQRGTGKTHLLGLVCARVQQAGGYFVLVIPHDGERFWDNAAQALGQALHRPTAGYPTQLTACLARLCDLAGVLDSVRAAVLADAPLSVRALSSFTGAVRRAAPLVGRECQDLLRALVLLHSTSDTLQDLAHQYVLSFDDGDAHERSAWGLHRRAPEPRRVVEGISRLLALTGPSVVAVDQIDALLAPRPAEPAAAGDALSDSARGDGARGDAVDAVRADGAVGAPAPEPYGTDPVPTGDPLAQLAGGLMALRDITRRTLTVVACLPESWAVLKYDAVNTVADRFREAPQLHALPDAEVAQQLVAKRLGARYAAVGFVPPYPTWPVAPSAFAAATAFTPRRLLQRVDEHARHCLRLGALNQLTELADGRGDAHDTGAGPGDGTATAPVEEPGAAAGTAHGDAEAFAALDRRFAALTASAEVSEEVAAALTPQHEDRTVPPLLAAALTAWIEERGGTGYLLDPPPGRSPDVHARLRQVVDEHTEVEHQVAFRAIAHANARAVQCRIRDAVTAAGLRTGPPYRRLVLLRNTPWPSGTVTAQQVAAFRRAGGAERPLTEQDLRTFAALRRLRDENDPHLRPWLVARQPASRTELLAGVLAPEDAAADAGGAPTGAAGAGSAEGGHAEAGRTEAGHTEGGHTEAGHAGDGHAGDGPAVTLGTGVADGTAVAVPLAALRRHTAVFAGSGSGKTVLLRRLVEQCACAGVSAIVLDPNNDLARLGDPWPEPPDGWAPGDADRAAEYLAHTDVVVWTPGRDSGRPLSFQPLPDFASVRDDPDELRGAVEAAMSALIPRAKVEGRTSRAAHGQAVLREALHSFATTGTGGLKDFIALLADLPDGISSLERAGRIAAELAQNLTAATVNDPLFGGDGTPADPGVLLTPPEGKRARVSVVSMVGLPGDEQRRSFVNQLQMALFAWLRRHPAGDRPLGGLFVLDEAQTFAPAGELTACTRSTVALASQARKYGLGLVFATQAPKGLHNQIPGNAATQLFGFLNAPAQIAAATEMARAKGGAVVDISRLHSGEFYAAATGTAFQKVRSPMCLSHHPGSALTTEETLARARGTGPAA